MKPIIITTRKSPLALWQANEVARKLRELDPHLVIELLPLTTSGDQIQTRFVENGKGLFVKELEEALLDGRASLAVHSMKDVPIAFPEGLEIAAICKRASPFDAFVSPHYSTLAALPINAKVGTSSLRRQAQLLRLRPDLNVEPLRGNVQTRLNKLNSDGFDAIILAAAGLKRLNLGHVIRAELRPPAMLPACGQGAIGIECHKANTELKALLDKINCPLTQLCVNTERKVSIKLGGTCQTPIAIYCTPNSDQTLTLSARVLSPHGEQCIEFEETAIMNDAPLLAEKCLADLLKKGAKALIDTLK